MKGAMVKANAAVEPKPLIERVEITELFPPDAIEQLSLEPLKRVSETFDALDEWRKDSMASTLRI